MEDDSNAVSGDALAIKITDDSVAMTKSAKRVKKGPESFGDTERWLFLFHYYTMLIVFQATNYGKEESRFEDLPFLTRSYVCAFLLYGVTSIVQWAVHDMKNLAAEPLSWPTNAFERFLDTFLWFVWRFSSIYASVSLLVMLIHDYIA
ncbi:uncharacterized protein [Rutidosis leptorrhynchoides]|uniref:uncharacterized protein n=1 Tax=Rutidosis leptorrhynchoides TaxID=125765 RepID=UPI003A99F4E8